MSVFPLAYNTAAPDSSIFADELRHVALPTNSAWQNFAVNKDGPPQPEYIHPYLVQAARGSLSVCYPARVARPEVIFQAFVANIIISTLAPGSHVISRFDDLSVTLRLPGPLKVPLVRGSPYITIIVEGGHLSITSAHKPVDVSSAFNNTKHRIVLDNGQTWLIYTSDPLRLDQDLTVYGTFRGVVRIAITPRAGNFLSEQILDRFSPAYPVSGAVDLSEPFTFKYEWDKHGSGNLLMLTHPLHRQIMSSGGLVEQLSYQSIDGDLVGAVGDSWILSESPLTATWHSLGGSIDAQGRSRIAVSLQQDVDNLQRPVDIAGNTYFYGKAMARAARLAMIAEETDYPAVIPAILNFLGKTLTPWLDGTLPENAILYDRKWGGLVSRRGAGDATADFGLGVYNDHHYHLGYFCYAGAVLAKLNATWGTIYKSHMYAIVRDFVSVDEGQGGYRFTRLRNFDLWTMHSWASGLVAFPHGRNQESSSEAVNAYYSAALLGIAYGDFRLADVASCLAALEIRSAKALWHVPSTSDVYEAEFVRENRVVGIVWANGRESRLWFAGAERRGRRLGIQVLPIVPVTEVVFSEVEFARELVEWSEEGEVEEEDGWKGFAYALQAIYDREAAVARIDTLRTHDDGNSLSNLLWWVYTRPQIRQ